jgi:hypothetical protein
MALSCIQVAWRGKCDYNSIRLYVNYLVYVNYLALAHVLFWHFWGYAALAWVALNKGTQRNVVPGL